VGGYPFSVWLFHPLHLAGLSRRVSSTTGTRSATEEATPSTTSPSRATRTTATWPRSTTAAAPWLRIAARGWVCSSRRRLSHRDARRANGSRRAAQLRDL